MPIITLFSGSYCNAEEIAQKTAQRLDGQFIGEEEILDEASQRYGVARGQLARTLYGPPTFLKGIKENREQNVAFIRAVLANRIREDRVVYHGFGMHLLPKTITHILRVCLVADKNHLVETVIKREGVSEKKAKDIITKDAEKQLQWVRYVHGCGPWDEELYDIVIPMPVRSVDEAVDLVCDNAQKEVLALTPQSQQAVQDFAITAQVYLLTAKKWPWVDVSCEGGNVTLLVNRLVVRWEHLKKELATIASTVPGVKSVQTRVGPKYKSPPLHPDLEFELPSKVLLVDDEKEFVQTLSERLLARNLASEVAYNGEEALSQVAQEEPDVMVLDLKMPGIDGMEVLRRIKKERPNVEVIILTGHGSEADRELATELGAFAYLEKPVDIETLTQTMKEAYRKAHEMKGHNS